MVTRGFMKRGTRVVAHKYNEKPLKLTAAGNVQPPFELHFFPGTGRLFVVGVRP
jgi:hypothetical protein